MSQSQILPIHQMENGPLHKSVQIQRLKAISIEVAFIYASIFKNKYRKVPNAIWLDAWLEGKLNPPLQPTGVSNWSLKYASLQGRSLLTFS